MPSPRRETTMPAQSSAKSRSRRGVRRGGRRKVSDHRSMLAAIDGPAGAGKSTVARAVAAALGFTYLNTGAMYRAAALAHGRGLDPRAADIAFDGDRVLLGGEDVTEELHTPAVARAT